MNKTNQAKELEARQLLKKDLTEKGKDLIWNVCKTETTEDRTYFLFECQTYLSYKLGYNVSNK